MQSLEGTCLQFLPVLTDGRAFRRRHSTAQGDCVCRVSSPHDSFKGLFSLGRYRLHSLLCFDRFPNGLRQTIARVETSVHAKFVLGKHSPSGTFTLGTRQQALAALVCRVAVLMVFKMVDCKLLPAFTRVYTPSLGPPNILQPVPSV